MKILSILIVLFLLIGCTPEPLVKGITAKDIFQMMQVDADSSQERYKRVGEQLNQVATAYNKNLNHFAEVDKFLNEEAKAGRIAQETADWLNKRGFKITVPAPPDTTEKK